MEIDKIAEAIGKQLIPQLQDIARTLGSLDARQREVVRRIDSLDSRVDDMCKKLEVLSSGQQTLVQCLNNTNQRVVHLHEGVVKRESYDDLEFKVKNLEDRFSEMK